MRGIPQIKNGSVWVCDATCRALISAVKPRHGQVGYPAEPFSSPCHRQHPRVLLQAMHVLHLATTLRVTTSRYPNTWCEAHFIRETATAQHIPAGKRLRSLLQAIPDVSKKQPARVGCLQQSGSGPES